jgi:hypothetical protein
LLLPEGYYNFGDTMPSIQPRIEYDEDGRKMYILSVLQASKFALVFFIPLLLIMVLPFYLVWGVNALLAIKFRFFIFLVLFVVVGVALHELLHGVVWALYAKRGFRDIRFGIKWEYLTPYCHCISPLKVWQYIAGGIAPLILMGLAPAVWAMFTGNNLIMFFGIFYTWTAAGDILAVWMLRKFRREQLVFDHPEELGFILEEE